MTQSVDPDFARRVAEYERQRKKGVAFQAQGTLGGKRVKPARPAWRSNVFGQTLKILLIALIAKVVLFHGAKIVGFDPQAMILLDSSGIVQQLAVLIFYPDPISQYFSHWLTIGQQYLAIEFRRAF